MCKLLDIVHIGGQGYTWQGIWPTLTNSLIWPVHGVLIVRIGGRQGEGRGLLMRCVHAGPFTPIPTRPTRPFSRLHAVPLRGGGGGGWGLGGGGGGTDSFSLGTDLETTAPPPLFLFGRGQPLVLPSPNLQPLLFTEAQGQPLQIVIVNFLVDLI